MELDSFRDSVLRPEFLVYLAGAAQAMGLVLISQIRLRLLLLVGTGLYVLYYMTVSAEPLWSAIYMSLMMGATNLYGIGHLLLGRSSLSIPRAYRDLYPMFGSLLPGDFRAILRDAERKTLPAGVVITRESQPVSHLFFIVSGALSAEKRGTTFGLPEGIFVGEVAYITGRMSSATTVTMEETEVLVWEIARLKRRARRDARFRLALEAAISGDLAEKVSLAIALPKPDAGSAQGQGLAPGGAEAPAPRDGVTPPRG